MEPAQREQIERWFRRRGLPHLIEGRVATHDIWNRTLPFLVVVFLFQSLNAINLEADWPLWANALALGGGLGIGLGAWVVVNRLRGEKAFTLPARAGFVELTLFVVVPPLIPLAFGGQVGSAAATFGGNLVLLGVAYFVVSYGVVSLTGWGISQLGRQFGDVLGVVVRALPLLLLFATFIFVNAEAWQFTSELSWPVLAAVGALLFVVGALFAMLKVPAQISELTQPTPSDEVVRLVADTPASALGPGADEPAPLSRRQWGNVGLVIVVSEGIQVLLVSLFVLAFYVLFGFLGITATVVAAWSGSSPDVWFTWTLGDHPFVFTEQLLQVATFVALFSGLYFTVSLLTDATYREEFLDEIVDEVRQALAVRRVYLADLAPEHAGA